MKRNSIIISIAIILIAALALFVIWPVLFKVEIGNWTREKFNLGLDLQGGAQITYEADLSKIEKGESDEAISGVINVIRNRIDALVVAEPTIQRQRIGDNIE